MFKNSLNCLKGLKIVLYLFYYWSFLYIKAKKILYTANKTKMLRLSEYYKNSIMSKNHITIMKVNALQFQTKMMKIDG